MEKLEDMTLKEAVEYFGEWDLLDEIGISSVVSHFGESELLEEMVYDEDLCFETEVDLVDYVHCNDLSEYGLEKKFESMNDQEIFDRVQDLIGKYKVPYEIWDKFLKQYE